MKRSLVMILVCCVYSSQAQVDSLIKTIESRSDSVSALRAYLTAMGGTTDEAVAQFNIWMKKFPQSPSFPYVLGEAYYKKRERGKVIENWMQVLDMDRTFQNIEKRWPIVVKSDWDIDIPVGPNTIDSLKKVIAANPDSLLPVRQYIFIVGDDEEAAIKQLEKWEKQFPQSAAIPLAMGLNFFNIESPKAKPWLLKASALQPGNANVWVALHLDAERWGDSASAHEYMGKASAAAPQNPHYAYYYIRYYQLKDPALWRKKLHELAKRFPNDERGAQSLYEIAMHAGDTATKIRELEQLRKSYRPDKFNWSEMGMSVLYDLYLESGQTARALDLANAMGKANGWSLRQSLARGMARVNSAIKAKLFPEALKHLSQLKAPRSSSFASTLLVLRANIMHLNGQTQAAYDSLLTIEASYPNDKVLKALTNLGGALSKTNIDVMEDIWRTREKSIVPAAPFELGLYASNKKASLSDYRGKIILLTFWFPGCGPCRAEFPHFENVLKKFNSTDIAYLAVNVDPLQDDYVMPFLKGTGYSFVPLRGTAEWASQAYQVRGQPTNFLIDGKGRIIFSNFQISENNERSLELMINAILMRG